MIDLRNASRAELTYHGWRLGTFQAAAIFNPISAALLFITSLSEWLALVLLLHSAVGWYGWWRDYDLLWRVPTSPLCPECASPSQARSGPWEMCSQGHTFVRES